MEDKFKEFQDELKHEKIRNIEILLKDKGKDGEHIVLKGQSYSPYWLFHMLTGNVWCAIRLFNLETNTIEIIPYDEIHRVRELDEAFESLRTLDALIVDGNKKQEQYMADMLQVQEKREKEDESYIG